MRRSKCYQILRNLYQKINIFGMKFGWVSSSFLKSSFLFLFLLLSSLLIISKNVSAANLSINVEPTGNKIVPTGMECVYLYGTPQADNFCWSFIKNGNNTDYLSRIATNGTIPTTEGYYYEGIVYIRNQSEIPPDLLWSIYTTENFTVTDLEVITDETQVKEITLSQYSSVPPVEYSGGMFDYKFSRFYRVTLRARFTGDYQWAFGYTDALFWSYYPQYINYNGSVVYIQEINEYKPADGDSEMNKKDDQDRSDIQNQQSTNDSSASSDQSVVQGATQNVFGLIGNIVGAFDTPASDCVISITAGDNGAFQLNNINLCDAPPEIRSLTSSIATIIVTVACLFSAYTLITAILNLIRGVVK